LLSTGSLSSVRRSDFRCFVALIIAEHQASLPLADMSSMLDLMAEKKASSAPFRPINTMAAATLAMTASPWNCVPLHRLAASMLDANCSMSTLAALSYGVLTTRIRSQLQLLRVQCASRDSIPYAKLGLVDMPLADPPGNFILAEVIHFTSTVPNIPASR